MKRKPSRIQFNQCRNSFMDETNSLLFCWFVNVYPHLLPSFIYRYNMYQRVVCCARIKVQNRKFSILQQPFGWTVFSIHSIDVEANHIRINFNQKPSVRRSTIEKKTKSICFACAKYSVVQLYINIVVNQIQSWKICVWHENGTWM